MSIFTPYRKIFFCLVIMLGLAPLNALRAFEASARRGSFAAAADELNVTPAAVGQQVRHLEALVGASLFERAGRTLVLTERGAAALAPLKRGFELMGEASAALRDPRSARAITLAAPADLLSSWLAHDIASWTGEADLRLITLTNPGDPSVAFKAGADLALTHGASPVPGASRLMTEVITPLAAPRLALTGNGIERLADQPLIEDASLELNWSQWAAARGAYGADLSISLRAPDTQAALALARAGAGIVLGRKPLALDAIRTGDLVAVLADGDLAVNSGYDLVRAPGTTPSPVVEDLATHIKRRAAQRQDLSGEL